MRLSDASLSSTVKDAVPETARTAVSFLRLPSSPSVNAGRVGAVDVYDASDGYQERYRREFLDSQKAACRPKDRSYWQVCAASARRRTFYMPVTEPDGTQEVCNTYCVMSSSPATVALDGPLLRC